MKKTKLSTGVVVKHQKNGGRIIVSSPYDKQKPYCNSILTNIKDLTSEMDVKKDFVEQVAQTYNLNKTYVLQNWFQNKWKIPSDKIEEVFSMAQKLLYLQTKKKNELLKKTGFKKD